MIRIFSISFLLLSISGCALPRGTLVSSEITELANTETQSNIHYYLVTEENLLGHLRNESRDSFSDPKIMHDVVNSEIKVKEGDTISIKIWDSSSNSLLVPMGQRSTNIDHMTVHKDGYIFFPYIGDLKAAGNSVAELRSVLRQKYSAYMPSAQIQVVWKPGPNNSIEIISEKSGSQVLGLTSDTLTLSSMFANSNISLAGYSNPRITLRRKNAYSRFMYSDFLKNNDLDFALAPRDTIIIEDDDRVFYALGASGQQVRIEFDRNKIDVMQASTMVGGFDQDRADLQGVFILRGTNETEGKYPEIFGFDLTSAPGIFAAAAFQIRDNDILYVTEAPISTLDRLVSIAGRLIGLGNRL